jgi:hypothetical protein
VTLGERPEVIFVGGTRFSGADAVAGLLAGHREVRGLPVPVRFHSDPWGVPALLHGRIALDDFAERLRTLEIADRVPRERLESALVALRAGYEADPLQSCRGLFWALIHDLLEERGSGTLVESSPGNLVEAHTLTRLVPPARFVHVVRDGRHVAAAATDSEEAGTTRIRAGLEWWAGELREIERGIRGEEDGAPYAIPEDHLAVVVLDELVNDGTGAAYRRLLERLWLGEDGQLPDSSRARLDAAAIGGGGWRNHARGPARWWVTRRYERTLDELEAEGNHAAPALRAAFERSP